MAKQIPPAILTGDFIGSRTVSADQVNRAMQALQQATVPFGQARNFDLKFTRFRGDGWQVYLKSAPYVFEATLFLSATLRAAECGVDTRISAGIGAVETGDPTDLAAANGPAFHVSGAVLDRMAKRKRFDIGGQGVGAWQRAVFNLADQQSAGWSATQAEAVAIWLEKGSTIQEEVAERLHITRQAVQSRLAGAGLWALEAANSAFLDHKFRDDTE